MGELDDKLPIEVILYFRTAQEKGAMLVFLKAKINTD